MANSDKMEKFVPTPKASAKGATLPLASIDSLSPFGTGDRKQS
jgi:hypothetical protein